MDRADRVLIKTGAASGEKPAHCVYLSIWRFSPCTDDVALKGVFSGYNAHTASPGVTISPGRLPCADVILSRISMTGYVHIPDK